MISKRTKDALKAAKAGGVVLGRPQLAIDQKKEAMASAEALRGVLTELAHLPLREIRRNQKIKSKAGDHCLTSPQP